MLCTIYHEIQVGAPDLQVVKEGSRNPDFGDLSFLPVVPAKGAVWLRLAAAATVMVAPW